MYMDRVYVMHHNVPTVYDLGLIYFVIMLRELLESRTESSG